MKGAPANASTGIVGAELAGDPGDGVGDVGDVVRLQRAQPAQVGAGAERLGGDRTGAGGDVDAEADGVNGHDDVGVQHGGVDAVAAHRLHRDLGGEVGLLDGVEDRARAAHRAVLRKAAPGLAHEPHRGVRHRLAACGQEQGGFGHVC